MCLGLNLTQIHHIWTAIHVIFLAKVFLPLWTTCPWCLVWRGQPFQNRHAQSAGFEPARAEPNRFLVCRLNHSAKTACDFLRNQRWLRTPQVCFNMCKAIHSTISMYHICLQHPTSFGWSILMLWGICMNEKSLSEVGFEPTPGEPDCDLNAAP